MGLINQLSTGAHEEQFEPIVESIVELKVDLKVALKV